LIAVHLLTKQEVTQKLQELGYTQLEECPITEYSFWATEWGYHFFVPELPPDGMCADYKLYEIIADVIQTKPNCH